MNFKIGKLFLWTVNGSHTTQPNVTYVTVLFHPFLQVSNRDLLHATVALYDNCLPDITPEVLYSTVCDKWATTVLLVRNVEGELL